MYLALDQSKTCTGFAVGGPGMQPSHGIVRFRAEPRHLGHFGVQVVDWLSDMIGRHGITLVMYEKPAMIPGKAGLHDRIILYSLVGFIEEACARQSVPVAWAPVDDWRKDAYGFNALPGIYKHLGWKRYAVTWAQEQGFSVGFADEAEALGILAHTIITKHPEIAARTGPLFRRVEKLPLAEAK